MTTTRSPRRAEIDSFFTCQHPEQFRINWRTFYERAEARTDALRSRWPHELDLGYGPSQRHRLDIYLPTTGKDWPLLVFLHGGGFREGDPTLYGYLAEPYLERGIAFASVGYRLMPEAYLPATFKDVENALAWCFVNLRGRGIDTRRLTLTGHSAGAILTAQLAVRTDWLIQCGLPQDLIGVAVPISGVYDFGYLTDHREFFSEDADRLVSSPLLQMATTPPPMLVAYGSEENQGAYATDSKRLVDAARARGGQAELLELAGMTHSDTVDALGDASTALCQRVLELMRPLPEVEGVP